MSEERECSGPTCKAKVTWDSLNGRPHPFDRVKCSVCKGSGRLPVYQGSMFDEGNETMKCRRCKGEGKVMRSHFQSCPDAERFRKAGKRARGEA